MLKNSLHKKWATRFFVLIYLLLISSTGNAFFWCQDAEASSHLETNPGGTCWMPCSAESDGQHHDDQTPRKGAVITTEEGECLDSPVYSSAITPSNQNRTKNKATFTDINTQDPLFIQAMRLGVDNPRSTFSIQQLPPRQTMTALRTVVLRH